VNANRVLSTTVLLALVTLWIYREAIGQCNGTNNGCVDSVAVPCSDGTGICARITGPVPGGISNCSTEGNPPAAYYTYQPPSSWTDCVQNSNFGPCTRVGMACGTVWLFEDWDSCQGDIPCGVNQTSACTNSSFTNCN